MPNVGPTATTHELFLRVLLRKGCIAGGIFYVLHCEFSVFSW